jgi:flagellar basal body-associated protein FliL
MENQLETASKQKREMKRFRKLWIKRVLIGYLLCMTVYVIYLFAFQGLNITWTGGIQKNYAKYLVKQNDEFIGYMIEFKGLTYKTDAEYTEAEKTAIKENLEKQNEFLKNLQKNSPNTDNADYLDLYQDMLQIFAFYIQGEVMKAEYCYNYKINGILESESSDKAASKERYTMGDELCNMMGNMVLNNVRYINEIRQTNYQSEYNIIEMPGANGE